MAQGHHGRLLLFAVVVVLYSAVSSAETLRNDPWSHVVINPQQERGTQESNSPKSVPAAVSLVEPDGEEAIDDAAPVSAVHNEAAHTPQVPVEEPHDSPVLTGESPITVPNDPIPQPVPDSTTNPSPHKVIVVSSVGGPLGGVVKKTVIVSPQAPADDHKMVSRELEDTRAKALAAADRVKHMEKLAAEAREKARKAVQEMEEYRQIAFGHANTYESAALPDIAEKTKLTDAQATEEAAAATRRANLAQQAAIEANYNASVARKNALDLKNKAWALTIHLRKQGLADRAKGAAQVVEEEAERKQEVATEKGKQSAIADELLAQALKNDQMTSNEFGKQHHLDSSTAALSSEAVYAAHQVALDAERRAQGANEDYALAQQEAEKAEEKARKKTLTYQSSQDRAKQEQPQVYCDDKGCRMVILKGSPLQFPPDATVEELQHMWDKQKGATQSDIEKEEKEVEEEGGKVLTGDREVKKEMEDREKEVEHDREVDELKHLEEGTKESEKKNEEREHQDESKDSKPDAVKQDKEEEDSNKEDEEVEQKEEEEQEQEFKDMEKDIDDDKGVEDDEDKDDHDAESKFDTVVKQDEENEAAEEKEIAEEKKKKNEEEKAEDRKREDGQPNKDKRDEMTIEDAKKETEDADDREGSEFKDDVRAETRQDQHVVQGGDSMVKVRQTEEADRAKEEQEIAHDRADEAKHRDDHRKQELAEDDLRKRAALVFQHSKEEREEEIQHVREETSSQEDDRRTEKKQMKDVVQSMPAPAPAATYSAPVHDEQHPAPKAISTETPDVTQGADKHEAVINDESGSPQVFKTDDDGFIVSDHPLENYDTKGFHLGAFNISGHHGSYHDVVDDGAYKPKDYGNFNGSFSGLGGWNNSFSGFKGGSYNLGGYNSSGSQFGSHGGAGAAGGAGGAGVNTEWKSENQWDTYERSVRDAGAETQQEHESDDVSPKTKDKPAEEQLHVECPGCKPNSLANVKVKFTVPAGVTIPKGSAVGISVSSAELKESKKAWFFWIPAPPMAWTIKATAGQGDVGVDDMRVVKDDDKVPIVTFHCKKDIGEGTEVNIELSGVYMVPGGFTRSTIFHVKMAVLKSPELKPEEAGSLAGDGDEAGVLADSLMLSTGYFHIPDVEPENNEQRDTTKADLKPEEDPALLATPGLMVDLSNNVAQDSPSVVLTARLPANTGISSSDSVVIGIRAPELEKAGSKDYCFHVEPKIAGWGVKSEGLGKPKVMVSVFGEKNPFCSFVVLSDFSAVAVTDSTIRLDLDNLFTIPGSFEVETTFVATVALTKEKVTGEMVDDLEKLTGGAYFYSMREFPILAHREVTPEKETKRARATVESIIRPNHNGNEAAPTPYSSPATSTSTTVSTSSTSSSSSTDSTGASSTTPTTSSSSSKSTSGTSRGVSFASSLRRNSRGASRGSSSNSNYSSTGSSSSSSSPAALALPSFATLLCLVMTAILLA